MCVSNEAEANTTIYLRRDNLFSVHKFCIRHSFAMTFKHSQWFTAVTKIVIMYTMV